MINLASVDASFPLLKTNSVVTHVTARRSIAFEWLLIQSIATIERHPEYRNMSVEEFFSGIFGIKDTDTMIKPLIPGLIATGAVKLNGYSDELKMTRLLMGEFELTDSGRTMQALGKLPGTRTNNSITAYYDPACDKIWVNRNPYSNTASQAKGVRMEDVGDNAEFPIVSLFIYLQELRENEEERPEWMSENTDISDINETASSVIWRSEKHTVTLDDNMRLGIEGLEGSAAEKVLDTVAPTLLSGHELSRVKFDDPEDQIKRFALLNNDTSIKQWIHDFKDNVCFVDGALNPDILTKDENLFANRKGFCVKVVNNAGEFKCEARKYGGKKTNRMVLTVSIPGSMLPEGAFFVSGDRYYCAGRIPVTYKSGEYDADVIYEPNYKDGEQPCSLRSLLCRMVEKYYKEKNDVVFALHPVSKTAFEQYLKKLVDEEDTFEDKMNRISALNDISNKLIGMKYLKDQHIVFLLTNSGVKIPDTEGAISAIEAYRGINSIKGNDGLMRELIRSTLVNTQKASSLARLHDLMEYIDGLDRKFVAYLRNEGAAAHLYSDEIKRELISRFDDEDIFAEIPEYSNAENNLLEMRRLCDQLGDKLPEISVFGRESPETWMRVVLSHRDKLGSICGIYTNWLEELEKFYEVFGDIEILRDSSRAFSNAVNGFERLGEVLGRFYCDTSTFSRICIADTSALLHSDLLIERFEKLMGAMLIIPRAVLEELDGLKKDPEVGAKAQEIIRSINAKQDKAFLNISESSDPDLLPDDFDKDLNDNKIISVSLKYQMKNPTLLTFDINMANKAESMGIDSMDTEKYFELLAAKKKPAKKKK